MFNIINYINEFRNCIHSYTKYVVKVKKKKSRNSLVQVLSNNINETNANISGKCKKEVNFKPDSLYSSLDAEFKGISNANWPDVPSELSIGKIKKFPLLNKCRQRSATSSDEVHNISIFENGYQKLPSVKTIIQETMPLYNKLALQKWEEKMIKANGKEGFLAYKQDLFDRGKLFHHSVEFYLHRAEEPCEEAVKKIKGFWTSLRSVLGDISQVQVIESRVIHPHLHYQGIVDCIASYKKVPFVIEFKTSRKPKISLKSIYDDPLQAVAYLGALNYDPSYDMQLKQVLLVVAYESGLAADTHLLTEIQTQTYWRQWCERLKQFWLKQQTQIVDAKRDIE